MVYKINTKYKVTPEVYLDARFNKMAFDYSKGTFYAKKNTKPNYLAAGILNKLANSNSQYSIKQLSKELGESYRDVYKTVNFLEKEALLNIDYNENKSRITVSMPEYVTRELDAFEDWQSGEIEPKLETMSGSCIKNLEGILNNIKNKKESDFAIQLNMDGNIYFDNAHRSESDGKLQSNMENLPLETRVRVFRPEFEKQFAKNLKLYYSKLNKELTSKIAKFMDMEADSLYLTQVSCLGNKGEGDLEWELSEDAVALNDIPLENDKLRKSYIKAIRIFENPNVNEESAFALKYGDGILTIAVSNRDEVKMSQGCDKQNISFEIKYEQYKAQIKNKPRISIASGMSRKPIDKMSSQIDLGKVIEKPVKAELKDAVKDVNNLMNNGMLIFKK